MTRRSGEVGQDLILTGVFPNRAHPSSGVPIVIKGSGFDQQTTIRFGGRPLVEPVFVSTTTIMGRVPTASRAGLAVVKAENETDGGTETATLRGFLHIELEWVDSDGDGISDALDEYPPASSQNRTPLPTSKVPTHWAPSTDTVDAVLIENFTFRQVAL